MRNQSSGAHPYENVDLDGGIMASGESTTSKLVDRPEGRGSTAASPSPGYPMAALSSLVPGLPKTPLQQVQQAINTVLYS